MQLNNLVLTYIAKELNERLQGAFVNKIQEVQQGIFKFKFNTHKEGAKDLIVSCKKDSLAVFLTDYKFEAPKMPTGYALFLKKRLIGQKILEVKQLGFERILEFVFPEFILTVEMFFDGNIVLLDNARKILMPYKRESFSARQVKKDVDYVMPPQKEFQPNDLEKAFGKISEEKKESFKAFLGLVNVAPIYLEEAFFSAGVQKNKNSSELSEKDFSKIAGKISGIYSLKEEFFPSILELEKGTELSPVKSSLHKSLQEFKSINEAIDSIFSPQLLGEQNAIETQDKDKATKSLEYSLNEMLEARKKFSEQTEKFQEKGNKMWENFNDLQEIQKIIAKAFAEKNSEQ
ncbi:MAG: NFACT family protein, partial [Candidatus Diapherotrites archaeon]|nr:NFACT family protein [Candidatus Diapherotrites archaeon]